MRVRVPERGDIRRQLELLLVVASRQVPPTIRELMIHFGWRSTHAAWSAIETLVRRGWLNRDGSRRQGGGVRVRTLVPTLLGYEIVCDGIGAPRVLTEKRCSCGAAFFGSSCPICAIDSTRECVTT